MCVFARSQDPASVVVLRQFHDTALGRFAEFWSSSIRSRVHLQVWDPYTTKIWKSDLV